MVSAQVKAEAKEVLVNKDGMPTDEGLKLKHFPTNVELGSHLYKNDAKKLLGEGTEASPVLEKGQLLKIHLRRSKNLPWLPAIADKVNDNVMGLETLDSQPYAGGFHFVEHKKNMFSTWKIVLHDKDQNVIAVCLEEESVIPFFMMKPKVYHIYGVKPRHEEGDTPETDLKEGEQSLFKWARIEDICTHYFYTVSFWSGDNTFQDTFHGEQVKGGIFGGGIGKGVILRPTLTEKDKKMMKKTTHPVALLIQEKIFNAKSHTTGWEITVGPGLDPVIIVCVAAVLEHLMGANW
jgi:hypothetical protein